MTKKNEKIDIWLVWDIDRKERDVVLRAVTTNKERAETYKGMLEREHEHFNNPHIIVEVERRIANHLYGYEALSGML